jgi:hypothetical protein
MPRKAKTETTEVKAAKPAAVKKTAKKPAAATVTHKARTKKETAPVAVFHADEHREAIAQQAYFFWLERGGAHGNQAEDWLRAEAEVRRQFEAAAKV